MQITADVLIVLLDGVGEVDLAVFIVKIKPGRCFFRRMGGFESGQARAANWRRRKTLALVSVVGRLDLEVGGR